MAPDARNDIRLYSMVEETEMMEETDHNTENQNQSNHSMSVDACSSRTELRGNAFHSLLQFRDKLCCNSSILTDEDAIVPPKNGLIEKGKEASQSCQWCINTRQPSSFKVFFQNVLDIYHDGVITNDMFQRSESASPRQTMTYISDEEEYFAKRWDGHQPLTSMPVVDGCVGSRKTLRRIRRMPHTYLQ
jgi:hypothetical protein|eukprot:scaffold2016_cov268-Chaetoceros_neogracile.AAC.12